MKQGTITAIKAILDADGPRSERDRVELLNALGITTALPHTALPRIIKRPEVAALLGVSTKRCDQLAQSGALVRILAPGTSRAIGYSEQSVRDLVSGRAASCESEAANV